MNIKFTKITILHLMIIGFLSFNYGSIHAQNYPVWPIRPNDDAQSWNRVNSTFGEQRSVNNPRFHRGVDIDTDTSNCPVKAAQPGYHLSDSFSISGFQSVGIEILHEYPPGSENEYRKTRYLHLNNNGTLIPKNQDVGHGEAVGTVNNSDGHLHFEMWEYDMNENTWHMLNPLHNDMNWQIGSPPDVKNPEINNVLL